MDFSKAGECQNCGRFAELNECDFCEECEEYEFDQLQQKSQAEKALKEKRSLDDIKTIELFISKVNAVTCPFRHGEKIPERKLAALSNAQIEFEKWLAKLKTI